MEQQCSVHAEKRALSTCHSCGQPFCRECLIEGPIYYYCAKAACQQSLKEEQGSIETKETESLVGVKGWLLTYCVVQVYVAPALLLVFFITVIVGKGLGDYSLRNMPPTGIGELVIFTLLAGYGMHLGRRLWKLDPLAVDDTRRFLVLSFTVGVLFSFVSILGEGYFTFSGVIEALVQENLGPGIGAAVWYRYFGISKRVQQTYGFLPDHVVCRNPSCGAGLKLSFQERMQKEVTCPQCGASSDGVKRV